MKIYWSTFCNDNDLPRIEEFINDSGIQVVSCHIIPASAPDKCPILFIFYETPEASALVKARQAEADKEKLREVIRMAREISPEDARLLTIKLINQQMRDDFLLAKYNISSQDAGRVCDLLKPEMAFVLNWGVTEPCQCIRRLMEGEIKPG